MRAVLGGTGDAAPGGTQPIPPYDVIDASLVAAVLLPAGAQHHAGVVVVSREVEALAPAAPCRLSETSADLFTGYRAPEATRSQEVEGRTWGSCTPARNNTQGWRPAGVALSRRAKRQGDAL